MKRNADLLILLASVFALVLSLVLAVDNSIVYIPFLGVFDVPLCWIRSVTGINCPTCGLTRSFISIGDTHFKEALSYNKAGILAYVFVVLQVPYRIYRIKSLNIQSPTVIKRFMTVFTYILALSLLLNWAAGLWFI